MKYIILENSNGQILPIIFPEVLVHSEIAEYMRHLTLRDLGSTFTPTSAGFVNIEMCSTYGESESIGVESKENDNFNIQASQSFGMMRFESLPPNLQEKMKEILK